jgi:FecR protein
MNTHSNDPKKNAPASGDYLWDRSGTPDPEIQQLESLLAEFRHAKRPLTLPSAALQEESVIPSEAGTSSPSGTFHAVNLSSISAHSGPATWFPRLAAAAIILFAIASLFFVPPRPVSAPELGPGWNVANIEGTPQIGSSSISTNQSAAKLHVGQTLTTNSSSRASLSDSDLGEIQIDPNSRVRLLQTDANHKRLQLDVGTIHAAIWAPPGQFVVDTPSAVAVDLGCAYTLQVSPDGSGSIRTTLGWVGFHLNGRDSFIPAGAMCSTRPKLGPGTPYFEGASQSFREALHTFDRSNPSSEEASAALSTILSQARPRDGLTLWHLLSRTTASDRAKVYARFAQLVPPPAGVTRNGILQLDPQMLDLYWNALNLGDISIWRLFEQNSVPQSSPATKQMLLKKQALLTK